MRTTTASKIESARLAYVALCEGIGSDSVTEETAILSAGREFLPPCAVDAASVEYYAFLTEETEKAQAEHDREFAEGHEWHADTRSGSSARAAAAAEASWLATA